MGHLVSCSPSKLVAPIPCSPGQLHPRAVSMAPPWHASAAGKCSYVFKKGLGWGGKSISMQPFSQQTWSELAAELERRPAANSPHAATPLGARVPWGHRAASGARSSPWPPSLHGEKEEEAELGM